MRKSPQAWDFQKAGFTLIELLAVIAIIGVLAALILPVSGVIKQRSIKARARSELFNMEAAIESYKTKRGIYPPDNPNRNELNALFYELSGTVYTNNPPQYFQVRQGSATIGAANVSTLFGTPGFLNSAFVPFPANAAQIREADVGSFLPSPKSGQFLEVGVGALPVYVALGASLNGPLMFANPSSGAKINPWRYSVSNPTNNPNSFDLWIDILVAGKTNRVSNWADQPQIVY